MVKIGCPELIDKAKKERKEEHERNCLSRFRALACKNPPIEVKQMYLNSM
jgi:hypothetical protein